MIHKIYASDHRFKTVEFEPGLNIILADRKQESGTKDSRNGLGKSTLIKIIDFCLGADFKKTKKFLPTKGINDWSFFAELSLCGKKITVARSIDNPNIIRIEGDISSFPLKPETDQTGDFEFYKIPEWRKLLGICFFGLPNTSEEKYLPSFRSLISYFIRSGEDAYSRPFSHFRNQPEWNIQVNNAFFLGLNWEQARVAQEIKDKNKAIVGMSTAVKTGVALSKGALEAKRVHLQIEIDREEKALSEFRVHPQYSELLEQSNLFTQKIHETSNKNLILQRKLEQYKEAISSETELEELSVESVYEEAGLRFEDAIRKTLAEARTFHLEIVRNRKHFLQAEVEEIGNQISSNNKTLENDTNKRADLMNILRTHGALEEFMIIQKRLSEKKGGLENIKHKIADIEEMSNLKKKIRTEKIELETKLQRDYEQSRPDWEKVIAGFNENSQALYNESGNLIINVSDKGYSFDVEISRSSSEGVSKMKIFCYDLMLVDLFAKRKKINFLIHDSTIFEGVDSRQIAHALEHAHKKALESSFQYICTFNSDMLPNKDFSQGFDIQSFIRLTLKDQNPEDSLMGFRFDE